MIDFIQEHSIASGKLKRQGSIQISNGTSTNSVNVKKKVKLLRIIAPLQVKIFKQKEENILKGLNANLIFGKKKILLLNFINTEGLGLVSTLVRIDF